MGVKNRMRGLHMGCGERLCCQSRLQAQRLFAALKHQRVINRLVHSGLRRQ